MTPTQTYLAQIRALIAKDDCKTAIQQLSALLKDSPHLDEAVQQSARYNHVMQQIRLGLVDFESANIAQNQIRAGILDLLREVEEQELVPEIKAEVERAVSIVNSKNVVGDSPITAGGNVHIGDIIYGDKRFPHALTAAGAAVPLNFLGRENDLDTIRERLCSGNTLLLVNAEGGMGKTTLAAAYWKKYESQYKHTAWLFCENGILAAMRQHLPEPLQLVEAMNRCANEPEQQIALIKNSMANLDKDCLLVLDNANDRAHILGFLQHLNGLGWHVLLTSRVTKVLPDGQNEHRIEHLPPHLAKELFQRYYTEDTPQFDALLNRLLAAVGYNTLCVEIFSKNLSEGKAWGGLDLNTLLQQLEQKGLFLGDNSFTIQTDYTHNIRKIAVTCDDIIRALYDWSSLSKPETDLLIQFALLPPENHAPSLLFELLTADSKPDLKRRLDALAQKGWLATDTQTYRISPVVQKIVLQQNQDHCWELGAPMVEKLKAIFETEGYHSKNIATAAPYAALVSGLVEHLGCANEDLATLFNRLWVYYHANGNLAQALDTATRMQHLCQQYDDKTKLAISCQYLGFTHSTLGDLDTALSHYEDSNRLSKELYEAYPHNVHLKNNLAISYHFLGHTQTELGDLDTALQYYEESNRLSKELHEAYPNNVDFKKALAISCQNFGNTQTELGDLDTALRYYEEDLTLRKELYEAYPNNVGFINNLAISYSKLGNAQTALGDLDTALRYYQDYTRLAKELYEAYPNHVNFKNNLAISYLMLGRFYRDNENDSTTAILYIQKGYELYAELVRDFPNHVEFRGNYDWAKKALGY